MSIAAGGLDMRPVELLPRDGKVKLDDPAREGDGVPLEDDTRRALRDVVERRGIEAPEGIRV